MFLKQVCHGVRAAVMAEKSKEERKRQYQKQIADMHRQILDLDPSRNSGVPLLKLVSKHAQSGSPLDGRSF